MTKLLRVSEHGPGKTGIVVESQRLRAFVQASENGDWHEVVAQGGKHVLDSPYPSDKGQGKRLQNLLEAYRLGQQSAPPQSANVSSPQNPTPNASALLLQLWSGLCLRRLVGVEPPEPEPSEGEDPWALDEPAPSPAAQPTAEAVLVLWSAAGALPAPNQLRSSGPVLAVGRAAKPERAISIEPAAAIDFGSFLDLVQEQSPEHSLSALTGLLAPPEPKPADGGEACDEFESRLDELESFLDESRYRSGGRL